MRPRKQGKKITVLKVYLFAALVQQHGEEDGHRLEQRASWTRRTIRQQKEGVYQLALCQGLWNRSGRCFRGPAPCASSNMAHTPPLRRLVFRMRTLLRARSPTLWGGDPIRKNSSLWGICIQCWR